MKIQRSPGLPRGFSVDPEDAAPVALRPIGLLGGATAQQAIAAGRVRLLAGGPLAFMAAEIFLHEAGRVQLVTAPVAEIEQWAVAEGGDVADAVAAAIYALSLPRPAFAGLALDRPRTMGIVNVTPDSFYDGGRLADADAAVAHGERLAAEGADILDIGGESTRPRSAPVAEADEMDRTLPVIERLAASGLTLSVDTRRPAVMRAACAAGARIVNDVSALAEPGAIEAVAETGSCVVLMHMCGTPATMQQDPHYDHAPYEVYRYLAERVRACEAAGIEHARIAVDPGIGFGKTVAHNLAILDALPLYHGLGCAVLLGASRKSFIGRLSGGEAADQRLPGSLAVAALAAAQGVQLHRVHDVAATRQALALAQALSTGGQAGD
jgi:dihydropteroate synthase